MSQHKTTEMIRIDIALFAAALPDEIHPAGRVTIVKWLRQAQDALETGDSAEASRLLRNVNEKAALELGWFAEGVGIEDAEAVADVTRRAALGDIAGAAVLLRELETSHVA
jgi:hypothetical protein